VEFGAPLRDPPAQVAWVRRRRPSRRFVDGRWPG
jgi:hypothetical protein